MTDVYKKSEESAFDFKDVKWRNRVNTALFDMIRNQSKICLEGYMMTESVPEPIDQRTNDIPVYGFWLTLVLLSTEHMHVILKTHFNFSTLRPILERMFGNQPHDITVEMGESYMNEFSNLFGTKIKNALLQVGITTGMSLPLLTRGFDNYFFEENFRSLNRKAANIDNADHYHLTDVWSFRAGDCKLVYSAEIDIMSHTTYEKIAQLIELESDKSKDPSSSSQLEFL